jgi:hypothetical protein
MKNKTKIGKYELFYKKNIDKCVFKKERRSPGMAPP